LGRESARVREALPIVELLRTLTLDQNVTMVESLEISFDHVGAGVIDPHDLSVWVTIKESLSDDSENGGKLPPSSIAPDRMYRPDSRMFVADLITSR
jgi:hypothetical protein